MSERSKQRTFAHPLVPFGLSAVGWLLSCPLSALDGDECQLMGGEGEEMWISCKTGWIASAAPAHCSVRSSSSFSWAFEERPRSEGHGHAARTPLPQYNKNEILQSQSMKYPDRHCKDLRRSNLCQCREHTVSFFSMVLDGEMRIQGIWRSKTFGVQSALHSKIAWSFGVKTPNHPNSGWHSTKSTL